MTQSELALRAAMSRLLAGAAARTDGALTKKNLYTEAGVSRATMNRAVVLLREWDEAVAAAVGLDPDVRNPLTPEVALQRELRAAKRQVTELNKRLSGAASLIAILSEDNRYLQERLANSQAADLIDLDEYRSR